MLMTLPWRTREETVEPVQHGAEPRVPSQAETAQVDPDWYWRPLILLTLLMVFAGVLISGARDTWAWFNRPLMQVHIQGYTSHLDKAALAQQLAATIKAPLFDVDLGTLRSQIISNPWVHNAAVKRSWPAALEVDVVEEVPVARWGNKGLLNNEGDIFWPELKPEYSKLPLLKGPANSTDMIMAKYRDLSRLFASADLKLTGLELEPRGAWSLHLDNGIEVLAGRENLVPRLKRFLTIYQDSLAAKAAKIRQVDIRYTNGVAVSWRHEETNKEQ